MEPIVMVLLPSLRSILHRATEQGNREWHRAITRACYAQAQISAVLSPSFTAARTRSST